MVGTSPNTFTYTFNGDAKATNYAITMVNGTLEVTKPAASGFYIYSVKQRYPWNGLVDFSFVFSGMDGMKYDIAFSAKDMTVGTNITMATVYKEDGSVANMDKEQLTPGTYNWVWNAAADLPKDWKCDRVTVTGIADVSAFPYSVKFNANGGTGTMSNESFTYGTAKALTANAFTRTGYTFQGWATSANGAKAYSDKQSVSNLATSSGEVVNLYAVWTFSKVQLWSGGPYWAEMNIGAGKPSDYGYYFWWGDTIGYKRANSAWVASDGSSSGFPSSSSIPTRSQYHTTLRNNGWTTSSDVLASAHDAAQVQWGGGWRMPTFKEFKNLIDKCDWTWTTMNNIKGYVVRGKGDYASASIFLPAAGITYTSGNQNSYSGAGSNGYYWSSVPNCDGYSTLGYDTSCRLTFTSSSHSYSTSGYTDYNSDNCSQRYCGLSIRPVSSTK